MELRQLRYFLKVAEELSFSRAAEKLNISQPPLSQQIKALEEDLGFMLFKRSSRSVELTPQGDFFREETIKIFQNLEKASKKAMDISLGKKGTLKIGFVALVTQSDFPYLIRNFKEKWPDINVELNDLSSARQLEAIENKKIDIGFINSHSHDLSKLSSFSYIKGEYKIALPENHRLASSKKICLRDLEGENFIFFKRIVQPALYDSIIQAIKKSGVKNFTTQDINQRITALALVAAGIGVSIVSDPASHLREKGVVYKKIHDPFPEFEIKAVWAKDNDSPRLKSFLKTIKKA